MKAVLLWTVVCAGLLCGCHRERSPGLLAAETGRGPQAATAATNKSPSSDSMQDRVSKSDEEWRRQLTPEQYQVLRQKGTERPFSGQFWNHEGKGVYRCAGCGQPLFTSESKFDSGCGWPSYSAPMHTNGVSTQDDLSHGMERVEVLCSRCGGHLGHVFEDGPQPTGLRYCINSASLSFEPRGGTNSSPPGGKAEKPR